LAICKQMIESMGGIIELSSELHKGSSFSIIMDFDLPNEEEINYYKEQQFFAVTNNNANSKENQIGTILLVEDNEVNQMLAETIIKEAGYEVITVENGIEAIQCLKNNTIELVLMDINMPEMDGYEATKKIREELNLIDLPIIAMTANALKGDKEKSLDAGMNDYISKPISSLALLDKINQWGGKTKGTSQDNQGIKPPQKLQSHNKFSETNKLDSKLVSINVNIGKSLFNDESLYLKTLELFIEQVSILINNLKDIIDSPKSSTFDNTFTQIISRLKNMSAQVGAEQFSQIVNEIEQCFVLDKTFELQLIALEQEKSQLMKEIESLQLTKHQ